VVGTTLRPFYPRDRPGANFTGGWVGPRADLDVCKKSRTRRDSIPGPSSPYCDVNTFHLGYKNQSVYAVSGTSADRFIQRPSPYRAVNTSSRL
jgi:hypothetical protein